MPKQNKAKSPQNTLPTTRHGGCPREWLISNMTAFFLKKTIFPVCKGVSAANRFLVEVGACVHFPITMAWNFSGTVHASTVSVSLYAHQSCCVWKILVFRVNLVCLLEFFCLLLCVDLWSLRGRVKTPHLGLRAPKYLTLRTLSSWGSLCLFPSTTWRSFSDEAWQRLWFTGIWICHWEPLWCYVSLAK